MNRSIPRCYPSLPRHAALLCALFSPLAGHTAPGDLDLAFSSDGMTTTAIGSGLDDGRALIQQQDGKLVVAGYSSGDIALARYLPDGSLDTSFDSDGKVKTPVGAGNDYGYALLQQDDGKLVVTGVTNNGPGNFEIAVLRYLDNGSLDTSFDSDGKRVIALGSGNDEGRSLIQQRDGKLVIAGYSHNGSNYDIAVVRLLADGSLDSSFGGDGVVITPVGSGDDFGRSVIERPNGQLVVGGSSANGTYHDFTLVQYQPDGSLDTGFGNLGTVVTAIGTQHDYGKQVIALPDGRLVLSGYTVYNGNEDFALVRYHAHGAVDTTFGSSGAVTTAIGAGDDNGRDLVRQADGKLVLAGYSHNGSNMDVALVRYQPDGSLDSGFGSGGIVTTPIGSSDDFGYAVVQQRDGALAVAGYSHNGSNEDFAVLRYLSGQPDSDADGSIDGLDAFPLDPAEWLDSDQDGTGNQADGDDDDDGIPDALDPLLRWLPLGRDAGYAGSQVQDNVTLP